MAKIHRITHLHRFISGLSRRCELFAWLVVDLPPEKILVSWDDDIPNIWKSLKNMFQTTNQLLFGSRLQERKHQWTQKIDHADFLTINLGASVPPQHMGDHCFLC